MDGMMAIPGILLAVAMMALMRASIETVVIAIAVPEIPRVVRLVRSLVLVIREQPYVQAAEAIGTRFHWILLRHVLPNAVTPLIVQGTFICASAVLFEAYLSFLGAGTPPEIPSWGNMMAEGPRRGAARLQHHPVPRHLPRAHGAVDQPARRRAARHARPEDRAAAVRWTPMTHRRRDPDAGAARAIRSSRSTT